MQSFPTLRPDLQVRPFSDDQGALFFDVSIPSTPNALRLYDVEWILAERLSSSQNPEEVRALAKQLFDYVPEDKELLVLMEALARFGLCQASPSKPIFVSTEPKPAQPTVPTAVMPRVMPQDVTPLPLPKAPVARSVFSEASILPIPDPVPIEPTRDSAHPDPTPIFLQEPSEMEAGAAARSTADEGGQHLVTQREETQAPVEQGPPQRTGQTAPTAEFSLSAEQPELRSRSWIPIFFLLLVFVGIAYVAYLLLSPTPTP